MSWLLRRLRRKSIEQTMKTEPLPGNAPAAGAFFGEFFDLLRGALSAGGSELGLGLVLFALATAIRARTVVEIGRYKGFSLLALGGALRFLDTVGWQEPAQHRQRPDVNYPEHEGAVPRRLYSVDPHPTPEADALVAQAGLGPWVTQLDGPSVGLSIGGGQVDLLLIDGDHTYEGCMADVVRFLPAVRPGGYFVLHDYYGWYDRDGRSQSPIARVVHGLVGMGMLQHLLIDTGYMSFVIFRVPRPDDDPGLRPGRGATVGMRAP